MRLERDTRQRLGLMAGVAALAGLLIAGLIAPFIGGIAVLARASADSFDQLPSELETPPLPQASRILAADGSTIATFYDENRILVPLANVATSMRYAIIAIEDYRFYEHRGLDVQGALRAAFNNAKGGATQGGSTITQQYVKNVLVEQATSAEDVEAARAQDVSRKLRELKYALTLEDKLSKDQILENYLNIAYFGDGAYGVEAAARHFFSARASRLSLAESATLAGLVKSPVRYDPRRHPEAAKARRDTVLDQMLRYGFASAADVRKAKASPLKLKLQKQVNGCVTSLAPWFCDYLVAYFRETPELGGERALKTGGLVVRTTLDVKAQKAAQAAVDKYVRHGDSAVGALAMVEPGTGYVRALAESRDYAKYQLNLTVGSPYSPNVGGQPGSTFKVFTLASALEQGIPLGTRIYSPAKYVSRKFGGAPYPVSNADPSEAGTYDVLRGTWQSVNTFYVQLEERTGLQQPQELATAMGAHRADGQDWLARGSWTLGADEVAPLDLANAYATLAAHGMHCTPTPVLSVQTLAGKEVALPRSECNRALDAEVADTVTQVLTGVIDGPDAHRTGKVASIGRPAAGKTGTNTEYRGAWFAGYTPQLAAAVGVWTPKSQTSLRNVTIGGRRYARVFGATIPAPIWRDAMKAALAGVPVLKFPPASRKVAVGVTVPVPNVVGLSVAAGKAILEREGFAVVVSKTPVPSLLPAGVVAGMTPAGGSRVPIGTSIALYVSSGVPPAEPTQAPPATGAPQPQPTQPPGKPPKPKPTREPKPEPTATPAPEPSRTP